MTTLVIDGTHMCHRARHAFNLSYGGEDTSVTYGVMKMLLTLMGKYKPDSAIFCMDGGTPHFRRRLIPGYKAGRNRTVDASWLSFLRQLNELSRIIPYTGMLYVQRRGIEADDLVAQACRLLLDDAMIISGDEDLLQCVSDHVSMLRVGRKEDVLYTSDNFRQLVGYEPWQHVAVKALMGDSSDNIPGVRGVGPKTAERLINSRDILAGASAALRPRLEAYFESGGYTTAYTVMDLTQDLAGARLALIQAVWQPYDRRLQNWCVGKGFSSIIEMGPLGAIFGSLTGPRLDNLLPVPRVWDYKRYGQEEPGEGR